MSELFDKEVNAQKENSKKYFRSSRNLPQAHEKVCDENETKKQRKTYTCKNIFDRKEALYRAHTKTGENDLNKLRFNNSGHNEGTICIVNG